MYTGLVSMTRVDIERHAVNTMLDNTIGEGCHPLFLAFLYPGFVGVGVPLNRIGATENPIANWATPVLIIPYCPFHPEKYSQKDAHPNIS